MADTPPAAGTPAVISTDPNSDALKGQSASVTSDATSTTERPAWLPEGFNTPEEFAKAYDELKTTPAFGDKGKEALATKTPEEIAAAAEAAKAAPPVARTDDEIKTSLKAAGGIYADARYEAAALEFEKTGDVTPATRQATADAFGVPIAYVDEFIKNASTARTLQGTTAETAVAAVISDIQSVAGGAEEYGKVAAWALANLPLDQQKAYNDSLEGDALKANPNMAKGLLASIVSAYKAAGNQSPRDITQAATAQAAAAVAAEGYKSQGEQNAAMADPRYQRDEAYRQEVAGKIARRTF